MKKALFLIVGVVASCFLLANIDTINSIVDATRTGATVPLVVACVVMIARHLTQAVSYKASFEAVGFKGPGVWSYIVLIFSLVFINTFCLFSGATGVAFIIDDAHRKGADIGHATSGAILSQIGYFAAVLVISIIGFTTMIVTGNVNVLFVAGAAVLALTLVVLSALFFVGYYRPNWLERLFAWIERIGTRIGARFGKRMPHDWGHETAASFIKSANVMGENPSGTVTSIAWASFSALLNMLCLVAIGYAFGFENVAALISAFALGAISVVLSPTPQGIGVVEAAIAAVLTAYGCSLATATAIALVYRGIMFWMPFCVGAVLLSQSGFFHGKKNPTQEQRAKDTAWLSGTLVAIVGLVNVGESLAPQLLAPYQTLAQLVDFGNAFAGPSLAVFGVVLLVMAVGLVKRWRTFMALTMSMMLLMAGFQLLYFQTWPTAIASIVIAVWLFVRRDAFDRPMPWAARKERQRVAREQALAARRKGEDAKVVAPKSKPQKMGASKPVKAKGEGAARAQKGSDSEQAGKSDGLPPTSATAADPAQAEPSEASASSGSDGRAASSPEAVDGSAPAASTAAPVPEPERDEPAKAAVGATAGASGVDV